MILEGLGPSKKMFEDLDPGDYLFEIVEPGNKGWLMELVDKDINDDPDPTSKLEAINWRLKVIQPEEMEGRNFFHSTWLAGSTNKIAKAKKPWDPSSFTYQFLRDVGVAVMLKGDAVILDEYLDEDGWFLRFTWEEDNFVCDTNNLNKTIGVRFWGSVRKEKRTVKGEEKEFSVLTSIWQDK